MDGPIKDGLSAIKDGQMPGCMPGYLEVQGCAGIWARSGQIAPRLRTQLASVRGDCGANIHHGEAGRKTGVKEAESANAIGTTDPGSGPGQTYSSKSATGI